MRRPRNTALIVAVAALLGLAGYGVYSYSLRPMTQQGFQGWIEGYFIFVSPDEAGRIETLSVKEGDEVTTGQLLFALDSDLQRAAMAEAEAAQTNAKLAFDRAKALLAKSVGSQKTFDDAESALRTADARRNSARTHLDRRRMASPVNGSVQEIYFRAGEMVPAGRPIVSLLPPGNTRVRFFVPQATLPTFKLGDAITISCDGCRTGLTARISFISAQAEFTPPVIYSQEERARLVFRIEAVPDSPDQVRVGQPVTVMPRQSSVEPAGGPPNAR